MKTPPTSLMQLYFVLSSLLGLGLSAIGAFLLVDLLLTRVILQVPPPPRFAPPEPAHIERVENLPQDELTPEQKQALEQWRQDYQRWQEEQAAYNYQEADLKRQIASGTSLLVVGLPILLFHAPWIFRKAA